MSKNKKGFTLIELLAVIVILAIIMVIAVPKILDIINNIIICVQIYTLLFCFIIPSIFYILELKGETKVHIATLV